MSIGVDDLLDPKQLVWRCRRGVRELDVLFARFLEEQYASLSQSQQADFQRLLEVQDPTIMDWLFAKEEPTDLGLANMIFQLRALSGLSKL